MQIIQAPENEWTMRQRAFQQGMGNLIQGGTGVYNSIKENEKTLRQQALEDRSLQRQGLMDAVLLSEKAGVPITAEQVQDPSQVSRILEVIGENQAKAKEVQLLQNQQNSEAKRLQLEKDQYEANQRNLPYNQRDEYKKLVAQNNLKNNGGRGQRLSSSEVRKVNEGNSIPNMLTDIEKTIMSNAGDFGPIEGTLRSWNPYDTRAKTTGAQMSAGAQAFGRYMEGGVLRKEDEEKYRKMFPQLSDTPEVARNKLAIVRKMLVDKQKSDVSALAGAGYDVSSLEQNYPSQNLPDVLTGGASGSWQTGNEAYAGQVTSEQQGKLLEAVKGMSRQEKLKLLGLE